jgi:surface antigen
MRMCHRYTAFLILTIGILFFLPASVMAEVRVGGCQCTDYVYSQRPDIPTGMGHARDWLYSARVNRLPYDQVPQVGDVAVFLYGEFGFSAEFGHVAMVTEVSEDRSTFSIAGWNGFKNDCRVEVFHHLPVTRNTFFIHRIIQNDSTSAPFLEWPRPNQGLIDLTLIEF